MGSGGARALPQAGRRRLATSVRDRGALRPRGRAGHRPGARTRARRRRAPLRPRSGSPGRGPRGRTRPTACSRCSTASCSVLAAARGRPRGVAPLRGVAGGTPARGVHARGLGRGRADRDRRLRPLLAAALPDARLAAERTASLRHAPAGAPQAPAERPGAGSRRDRAVDRAALPPGPQDDDGRGRARRRRAPARARARAAGAAAATGVPSGAARSTRPGTSSSSCCAPSCGERSPRASTATSAPGVILSGGVDSSVVLATATRPRPAPRAAGVLGRVPRLAGGRRIRADRDDDRRPRPAGARSSRSAPRVRCGWRSSSCATRARFRAGPAAWSSGRA